MTGSDTRWESSVNMSLNMVQWSRQTDTNSGECGGLNSEPRRGPSPRGEESSQALPRRQASVLSNTQPQDRAGRWRALTGEVRHLRAQAKADTPTLPARSRASAVQLVTIHCCAGGEPDRSRHLRTFLICK